MRIAILNWSNRRIGGTGTYLSTVTPHLLQAGHQVALWHEVDDPAGYDLIPLPASAPSWSVAALGLEAALSALHGWQPHLLYSHGLVDPEVERRTLEVAPAVFFAHNYYGTCVSGTKTFTTPIVRPCDRQFGWQCLAHYYPRRCGGLSPISMVREYRRQGARLDLLSRYRAILTHSSHMQKEYIKHGLNASRVFNVRYGPDPEAAGGASVSEVEVYANRPWRLLFVGRMDALKGGRELLQALPNVVRRLNRELHVTFAGDGELRSQWEALSARVHQEEPRVRVDFTGWVSRSVVDGLFAQSDLLVLPSLWPEPLALVGLEAARHRLPVAAFDVGGISDWLRTGINGFLAPGDPPTVAGLVEAIVACLHDPKTLVRLKDGAARLSVDFAFEKHVELLLRAFDDAAHAA